MKTSSINIALWIPSMRIKNYSFSYLSHLAFVYCYKSNLLFLYLVPYLLVMRWNALEQSFASYNWVCLPSVRTQKRENRYLLQEATGWIWTVYLSLHPTFNQHIISYQQWATENLADKSATTELWVNEPIAYVVFTWKIS